MVLHRPVEVAAVTGQVPRPSIQPGLSKHGEPASPRGIVTRGNGEGLCRIRV